MPTESIMLVVGARDEYSKTFNKASKDVDNLEQGIGNTADTSARTTASLALMMQTMDDSAFSKIIGDLGLVKAGLDQVRAATADNATSFEKVAAAATFVAVSIKLIVDAIEAYNNQRVDTKFAEQLEKRAEKIKSLVEFSRDMEDGLAQFQRSQITGTDNKIAAIEKAIEDEKSEIAKISSQLGQNLKAVEEIQVHADRELGINFQPERLKQRLEEINKLEDQQIEKRKSIMRLEQEIAKIRISASGKSRADVAASLKSSEDRLLAIQEENNALKNGGERLENYELMAKGIAYAHLDRAKALIQENQLLKEAAETEQKRKQDLVDQETRTKSHLATLQDQLNLLKLGAEEYRNWKIEQLEISDEGKRQAQVMSDQIQFLKERNALEAQAKQIIESNRTPLERFRAEYQKLAETFAGGFLDKDQFTRQLEKLKSQARGSAGGGNRPRLGSLGVQAESSRFLTRGRGGNTQELIADKAKEQVELTKDLKKIFNEINAKIGNPGNGRVPVHKGGA